MYGPMKTATERYENDPSFRRLVCALQHELENATFTPSELRMAVILAATQYEYRHARPMIYGIDPEMKFWSEMKDVQEKD